MINIAKPYLPQFDRLQGYIKDIYASGWITNNGPLVRRLETGLEEYLAVANVILVSNGTVALQAAYRALGLTGDVVTTPFSYIATASSLCWQGLRPVFSDIDPASLNLDPDLIEDAITEETSAILPVHVFGNACDVERIENIGRERNLPIIYDAAHAFGVKLNGESLLKHGEISILSFHATKLFHTIEGGAIITGDDALTAKLRRLRDFGLDSSRDVIDVGINAHMSEFSAAMGLCVLEEIESILAARKYIHETYDSLIADSIVRPRWAQGCTRNWHYYPLIFDSEPTLLAAVDALGAAGVIPRRYFHPSLESVSALGGIGHTPISADIASRILCIPGYPGLDEAALELIAATINKVVGDRS